MPNYNVTVALGSGGTGLPTGVYNVMAYGAAGDGSTDDTAAIQACFDAVEAAGGGEIYFPNKTFRTTATLKLENPNNDEFYKVKLGQATIVADASLGGPILELGDQAEQHYHIDVEGGWLTMASRDWTDTVGLQLNNVNSSKISGVSAKWCEKGLELTSVTGTDSCAYNTINMRHIADCLYGYYIECDGLVGGGWVNENYFYGDSRVSYSSGLAAVDCSGGAGIYLDRTATDENRPNGNTFSGISLEFSVTGYGGTKPPAFSGDCSYTTLIGMRLEGWDSAEYLNFESGSAFNQWIGGYLPSGTATDALPAAQVARCSFIGLRESVLVGGTATTPALGIRSQSSTNIPFGIYTFTGTSMEYQISDAGVVKVGSGGVDIQRLYGNDSPEGAITANRGSIYQRRTGGIGQGLYIKESGVGNTGWVPFGGLPTTATADDTTPTVDEISILKFGANTGATAVTQLDDGRAEQIVLLVCTSATNSATISDGGNFALSADWTPTTNDTLTLYTISGSTWIETARSNN